MKPLLPLTLLALLLTPSTSLRVNAAAWAVAKTNAPRIYPNGLPA